MWRTLLTYGRSVSQIEHIFSSAPSRSCIGCRRLFASGARTNNRETHPNTTNVPSRLVLSADTSEFHKLDKALREKSQEKYKAYEDVKELEKRAPNFSVADWHEFLCAISAMGIYGGRIFFAKNELSTMTEIIRHLAKSCERFEEPIDYFNFVRLLLRFEDGFNRFRNPLPDEVEQSVSKWFLRNYHRLEASAFFEIFLIRTQWLNKKKKLKIDSEEDIMKLLEHGGRMASEYSGIISALEMLQIIDYYSNVMQQDDLAPYVFGILDVLAARKLPANQSDLCTSLKFVVGEQRRVIRERKNAKGKTREVFRRFAQNSPQASWNWLRNSIELVIDSEEFEHLKQLAAFAAVDAYNYKAIDFGIGDLARFLSSASEPYLRDPAYVLERENVTMPTVGRTKALQLLLEALYNALVAEPRLRDRLPLWVRFDDAYWDRFFDMLQKQAAKKEDCRRLFGGIDMALRVRPEESSRASFQLIVAKPINHRRGEIMRILTAASLT